MPEKPKKPPTAEELLNLVGTADAENFRTLVSGTTPELDRIDLAIQAAIDEVHGEQPTSQSGEKSEAQTQEGPDVPQPAWVWDHDMTPDRHRKPTTPQ